MLWQRKKKEKSCRNNQNFGISYLHLLRFDAASLNVLCDRSTAAEPQPRVWTFVMIIAQNALCVAIIIGISDTRLPSIAEYIHAAPA